MKKERDSDGEEILPDRGQTSVRVLRKREWDPAR